MRVNGGECRRSEGDAVGGPPAVARLEPYIGFNIDRRPVARNVRCRINDMTAMPSRKCVGAGLGVMRADAPHRAA
ncbi:hypothetical protein WT01_24700 [Burkholderia cepacia]|nr:hypothetical protein WT01_24700 [Burkholderia cepacia]